ncbi:MAG TPA: hypothetical protein VMY41_18885 [Thermohalobaculum sp.]|nr:hypothetical protein [Thermohalobaculum sp.]
MMAKRPYVLMFAEDTGAANYLAEVPRLLAEIGVDSRLVASQYAARHFDRLGVACERGRGNGDPRPYFDRPPIIAMAGTGNNLDSFGLRLIDEARMRGIETVGVVDQRQNLGDRFRGRSGEPLYHRPDWILVPDLGSKNYFVSQGCEEKRILVCGHPNFDNMYALRDTYRESDRRRLRARMFPKCTDIQRLIVFGTEPAKKVRGSIGVYRKTPDYTLTGFSGTEYRTHIVIEEFLGALRTVKAPVYTVLRLHPHDPDDHEFEEYYGSFDAVSRSGLPLELMLASDLVVSLTSMLLIEAALLGRPTLSILPRRSEAQMLISIERGLTPCVYRREDLMITLDRMIAAPEPISREALERIITPNSIGRIREFLNDRIGAVIDRKRA